MDVGSIGNDLCATPKLLTSFFISWSSHFHVMQLSNKKKTVYEQNKKNTKERKKVPDLYRTSKSRDWYTGTSSIHKSAAHINIHSIPDINFISPHRARTGQNRYWYT